MKIGLTEQEQQEQKELEEAEERIAAEKRQAKKERRELEEEQGRQSTAMRKAKKELKVKRFLEISEQYTSHKNTGVIDWIPKHSLGKERWIGTVSGKQIFKLESATYTYSLRILDKDVFKQKTITERSFDKAVEKAEKIIKNYLKLLKTKKKDEV